MLFHLLKFFWLELSIQPSQDILGTKKLSAQKGIGLWEVKNVNSNSSRCWNCDELSPYKFGVLLPFTTSDCRLCWRRCNNRRKNVHVWRAVGIDCVYVDIRAFFRVFLTMIVKNLQMLSLDWGVSALRVHQQINKSLLWRKLYIVHTHLSHHHRHSTHCLSLHR